jgi:hypothetical protein
MNKIWDKKFFKKHKQKLFETNILKNVFEQDHDQKVFNKNEEKIGKVLKNFSKKLRKKL